ncbi:YqzE family protein [Lentibacillus cibarius]|uniref:YqzE family protein n=1 Tax=Lentibacillus cibarius TaxID=2583219 RepID=A0A5S3QG36_9BACI|nr:YqzE family protein [Lentibacillus cibarius]TMN20798.1 YqzE family protein [Lentibacillus cibarius]
MSVNEYVKYMTQQFTKFIDRSPDEKRSQKPDYTAQPVCTNRWLGLLPFAWKLFLNKAD